MSPLTENAAKELGRALRFIRTAKDLSLREVARIAPISPQYLQNIERGERVTVSSAMFERLAHVYALPPHGLDDLVLKARVMSALELRGIEAADRGALWRVIEHRLSELGVPVKTNIAEMVAEIIG